MHAEWIHDAEDRRSGATEPRSRGNSLCEDACSRRPKRRLAAVFGDGDRDDASTIKLSPQEPPRLEAPTSCRGTARGADAGKSWCLLLAEKSDLKVAIGAGEASERHRELAATTHFFFKLSSPSPFFFFSTPDLLRNHPQQQKTDLRPLPPAQQALARRRAEQALPAARLPLRPRRARSSFAL